MNERLMPVACLTARTTAEAGAPWGEAVFRLPVCAERPGSGRG